MNKATRTLVLFTAALFALAGAVGTASAATITWLNMAPTAIGSPIPNGQVINVPGIGNVTITYSIPANFTYLRQAGGGFVAGNVGAGAYTWTNYESFSTIFTDTPDPLVPLAFSITYTFPGPLAAGSVFVGSIGLGQTTSFGGGASVYTVNQNGAFLGDYTDGGPWGPTAYTGGPGTFSLQNSVNGAGGANPWWNTPLGVVKVTDQITSLTVNGSQIRGDGIAVNIGFDIAHATPTNSSTWGQLKSLYR